jgi:hypothetical protein
MTTINSVHHTPASSRRDLEHVKQEVAELVDELARVAAVAKAGEIADSLDRDTIGDLFADVAKRTAEAANRLSRIEDALRGPEAVLAAA